MWVDFTYQPAMLVEAAIWLPAATIACLGLLPLMKGATIGVCWAKQIVRDPLVATPSA
jgi:uncharacterized protein (DUF983 family)